MTGEVVSGVGMGTARRYYSSINMSKSRDAYYNSWYLHPLGVLQTPNESVHQTFVQVDSIGVRVRDYCGERLLWSCYRLVQA